jgi:3-phenylpropionate/trans-cinnamate dioxygenase ferredoxin subunit
MDTWTPVAKRGELHDGDVVEAAVGGHILAVYRLRDDYFVTNGICTHQRAHLADGLVIGRLIECPKHQGRFDIGSGAPKGAPASLALRTYPVRIEGEDICVTLDVIAVDP